MQQFLHKIQKYFINFLLFFVQFHSWLEKNNIKYIKYSHSIMNLSHQKDQHCFSKTIDLHWLFLPSESEILVIQNVKFQEIVLHPIRPKNLNYYSVQWYQVHHHKISKGLVFLMLQYYLLNIFLIAYYFTNF